MTLKKLISHYGWLNIEAALLNEYPQLHHQLSFYEAVYHKLLLLPGAETDLQIELKPVLLKDKDTYYMDVYGKKQTPHVADAEICLYYALHFTPWAEWLAMPVSAKTLQTFSQTEIIAHCLHTMTIFSFDEADIHAECERLTTIISLYAMQEGN